MRIKIISLLIAVLLPVVNSSAVVKYYFYVQLADKNNTPYSLSTPSEYLSERAITRRTAFNIAIDSTDLPVNATYISQIANKGVTIHCRSKWMNGVTVLTSDSSVMTQVRALPFVKWAIYTGKRDVAQPVTARKSKFDTQSFNYGTAATQLNMLNASYLHNQGFTGKNIHVAVLDAGFTNANINPGFDSLRLQGRLLGTKDFTETVANIYGSDTHGSNVLSIMTGNLPDQYLGAAPHASFWLIRTEYTPTEYPCETDFWVAGIEFADSVGADVANSSLGYTTFDDPAMNYTYSDMNGTHSRASRAATLAAQKGIVVCNSAGNEGDDSWHYIGVPADAPGIVTVGATTSTGEPSVFTSYGPTADNRLKPDISAMGTSTAYINTSGIRAVGNGTSYSSPLMAGIFACFLQYAKSGYNNISVPALIQAVKQSGSLYANPTNRLGCGIPDFQLASTYLSSLANSVKSPVDAFHIYQNKSNSSLIVNSGKIENASLMLYNASGIAVCNGKLNGYKSTINIKNIESGIYILQISGNNSRFTKKVILE